MRRRLATVTLLLLASAGCDAAVNSAAGPDISPAPTVAPLAFTFATDGPILDLFCPDALGRPTQGLDAESATPQP